MSQDPYSNNRVLHIIEMVICWQTLIKYWNWISRVTLKTLILYMLYGAKKKMLYAN